ncbi:MAG: sarcosine oxidase subunit gamma family protein [Aestuariivirga sp.]
MSRASALQTVAVQGRFGADKGAPGVTLSVIHPLSIVTVIARKGKAKALAEALAALKKVDVLWAGADQFYVQAQGTADGALYADLKNRLAGLASVSDQSHGRVALRLGGPKARSLLAKGTPVDLHPTEFAVGKSALTQMAHVSVHLTRTGTDEFTLSVFRGFSESFWDWLTSQAAEFGYQVK